jgi:hypothetical protein
MLDARLKFDNYIETGTYLGMTTHFLASIAAKRNAQVYSCELTDQFYNIARQTVGNFKNVHIVKENSVDFLQSLAHNVYTARNFVYLDAHWYDYLPLRDELEIVKAWSDATVMIDDFKVPFDSAFGWDRYDERREICFEHIHGVLGEYPIYFPKYPARDEKVPPRGYCVIAFGKAARAVLDWHPLLRRYDG